MKVIDAPYARLLGLRVEGTLVTMAEHDGVLGRRGFLHGGAIAGLLDHAAWIAIRGAVEDEVGITPIGTTIDYLRGGRLQTSYARGAVTRLGRRVAGVLVTAWQDDPERPIASATVKFVLERGQP